MNDLVERLRKMAGIETSALFSQRETLNEAASCISQQDAELDRLRQEVEEAKEFRSILEGHLAAAIDDYNEARKAAFIEAAEIAEEYAKLLHQDGLPHVAAEALAAKFRAKAEETGR